MKTWLPALILALAFQGGCRKAQFKTVEEKKAPPVTQTGGGEGTGTGGEGGNSENIEAKKLIVSVPVAELPFGGSSTTATAKLKDGSSPPVDWMAVDPSGKPVGTITPEGVFKTPDTGTTPVEIKIIAVLKSDPKVKGEVPLKIIPVPTKAELLVSVPVPELKIGGNKTTAVAEIKNGQKNPPVKWMISSPAMVDIGKIDPVTGEYTSPASGKEAFAIIITATLNADPGVTGSTNLRIVPIDPAAAGLIVEVPSPEIKAGGKEMQATAKLKDGTLNPPVKWSIVGPPGKDAGSINDKGMYKSPAKAAENIPVVITATLIANEAIKASVGITVLKDDQIFARCMKANQVFPIEADVYKLPMGTVALPQDWKKHEYKTRVCLENYNVPEREFTAGFPDLPGLFEDFGMTTNTTIIIPKDGVYKFRLVSDDGSKLWINNELVINNDFAHQTAHVDKDITLKAGKYPLKLDYFQGPRYKIALILLWQKPGETVPSVVPREAFE